MLNFGSNQRGTLVVNLWFSRTEILSKWALISGYPDICLSGSRPYHRGPYPGSGGGFWNAVADEDVNGAFVRASDGAVSDGDASKYRRGEVACFPKLC